ncbi:MAG: hypothetical protein SNJ73_08680, partial [Acetobacteraceae bacterium]
MLRGVRLGSDGTLRVGDAAIRLSPREALALAAELQANAIIRLVPRPAGARPPLAPPPAAPPPAATPQPAEAAPPPMRPVEW